MRLNWCKQLMWKNVKEEPNTKEKKLMGRMCRAAGSLRFNYISFAFRVSLSLVWARSSSSLSTFATLTFNGNHLITFTSDMEHWIWKSGKTRPKRVKNAEVEGVATRTEIPFYIILLNFHVNRGGGGNCWWCLCCWYCLCFLLVLWFMGTGCTKWENNNYNKSLAKGKNCSDTIHFCFIIQ